ncbi:hypothetical protein IMPR6_390005 [Imperialibacter sp. EC-SDR9]|nr:hypothetical protein IMPERIA75_590050 [Imperialibacter sp. 75]CAD5296950.1 hypothetical protein IMPERIA89_690050 [Imperialibacter sp. 89]VVT23965.1 hypothetical protein IMPR6_390005 [Imperialibacter sp. EC-SDR9]
MYNRRKSFNNGAWSAFSIMGDGLELRNNNNLRSSWYNVGIYYKRALSGNSIKKGFDNRFSIEDLDTL